MNFSIHAPSYAKEAAPATENLHSHTHEHGNHHDHGHTHDIMETPGSFSARQQPLKRNYKERAFTIGIGGPVGSGKTALLLELCKRLYPKMSIVNRSIYKSGMRYERYFY